MQLCIPTQAAWRLGLFPAPDLTPWGHWSFHNHFWDKGRHEYQFLKTTTTLQMYSVIQGWKVSWPSTLWSQNHTDEGTSLPFGPIYSLSQEELAALCKFMMRTSLTGFIHPSRSSHGAPVLFIQKKDGFSSTLCWLPRPQPNLLERPIPTSAHFNLLDTQEKHESTPKSTSGTHTISFGLHPETNGRLPSGPIMVPLNGW